MLGQQVAAPTATAWDQGMDHMGRSIDGTLGLKRMNSYADEEEDDDDDCDDDENENNVKT